MVAIPFGTGVFSVPEASRLLGVNRETVSRWFRGYSYSPGPGEPKRVRPPVGRTSRDLPKMEGGRAMSFLEFAELVVVAAFVRKGISLQKIRAAAECLMNEHSVERPFAYKRIFTDGHDVFTNISTEAEAPDLIKLTKGERLQIRSGGIEAAFVEEIQFSEASPHIAERYYPRGKDEGIVVDPKIAFGTPVIDGTRLTVTAVAEMVRGSSVSEVASIYGVSEHAVRAAAAYEKTLTTVV